MARQAAAGPLDGIYRERTLAGDTWLSVPPKQQQASTAPAPATPDLAPVEDDATQQDTQPQPSDAHTTVAQQPNSPPLSATDLPQQSDHSGFQQQPSDAYNASAAPAPAPSQQTNSLLDLDSPAEPTPPSAVFAATHPADLDIASTSTPESSATTPILDEPLDPASDSGMQTHELSTT